MKNKFKVGDRVKVVKLVPSARSAVINDIGVIKFIKDKPSDLKYAVEFDKTRSVYHTCEYYGFEAKTRRDRGYWCAEEMLELVSDKNNTIVIYQKGDEVIALDKRTGKKAVAKCNPRDTFDFDTGAKLAFERLTNNVTFRLLALKDYKPFFTRGKVYEFIDGVTTWDHRDESDKYTSYEDFIKDNICWKKSLVELKDGDDPEEILKKYSLLNTKICITHVINPNGDFTKGKIYEIKDGQITVDSGDTFPIDTPLKNIEDAKAYFGNGSLKRDSYYCKFEPIEFVEVVE